MIIVKKRKRAVSPVIATVLIIALVLAGTAIVFLVVMPMLNIGSGPNLVLLQAETFRDYDNDGDCDYMEMHIKNEIGGTPANITSINVIWGGGGDSGEAAWTPLTSDYSYIGEGSSLVVIFIPVLDDVDEIPNGAEIAVVIISDESSISTLQVSGAINVATGDPFTVEFKDGNENPVAGATIDFYKASGEYAYTGQLTNAEGLSINYLFPGHYYVRATEGFSLYYSNDFIHPLVRIARLQIQGGVLTVKVLAGGSPVEGALCYVYDTFGHYTGKSGVTGADGITTFSLENGLYKIRADVGGIPYYSGDVDFPTQSYVEINTGGGDIYCRVIDGGNNTIPNVRVYLFRATGQYFGMNDYTNDTGMAEFNAVPGGILFKFRVDYLAYRLWSIEFGAQPGAVIDVNIGGGTIYVNVTDGAGFPIQNTRTYLFTEAGSYSGVYAYTNDSGVAEYNRVAGGWFKIRIDYLAQRFWSPVFNATDGYIVQASIGGGTLFGNITSGSNPIVNVRVYLFTETGSYTGRYGYTNDSGIVEIQGVGESNYIMRVDYQAKRYYSPVFFFNETAVVPYDIGGGTVYANVTAGGTPIIGVRVYAFTPTGSYTGTYAYTNDSGLAEFTTLGGGDFKFRVDYLARRFWSDVFTSSDGLIVDVNLGGGTIYTHLTNTYGVDISGVRIYLFTETGSYTGKYAYTNASGIAEFTGIGEANFRFRADYLAMRFWSSIFLATPDLNFEFNIGGGIMFLHVFDGSGTDIDGPRAYLFTSTGSYTGIYRNLDSSGYASFNGFGNGTFKWRVDYLGKRFWSPDFEAINGTTLEFNIGGGTIYVHLTVDGGDVDGGRVYLFTDTGSYTGLNVLTNSTGWAEFNGVGDGDYRLRYTDGTTYWQNFTAQADLEVEFAIITAMMLSIRTTDASTIRRIPLPSFLYS